MAWRHLSWIPTAAVVAILAAPSAIAQDRIDRSPTDPFADIQFGDYHALVIGNNEYRHLRKLESAVNDATDVAALLKRDYGYSVTLLRNATRGDILGQLSRLRATLETDDNLLIYYAGHGLLDQVGEQGYWLPVDAEESVPTNWISTADITVMLRAIRAKHVMVVADSCYSGTLVRATRAGLRTRTDRRAWIERMLTKRSRVALVSGGLEPVIDSGGDGRHSVFATAFLQALQDNDGVMEGQALFDAIKRPVVVNSDQTPQYADIRRAGHGGGEFLFVKPRASKPRAPGVGGSDGQLASRSRSSGKPPNSALEKFSGKWQGEANIAYIEADAAPDCPTWLLVNMELTGALVEGDIRYSRDDVAGRLSGRLTQDGDRFTMHATGRISEGWGTFTGSYRDGAFRLQLDADGGYCGWNLKLARTK